MGSREASVTLLSRARTASVGHKAGCTEKRGNWGKNRALWRAVLSVDQIKDRSSWVPIWAAECKEGLKFNRHLAASGSSGEESPEGTNHPREILFLSSYDWLLPLDIFPLITDPCPAIFYSFSQLKSAGKCQGMAHLPPRLEAAEQCSRVSKSQFHLCQHQELPSAFMGLFPHLFETAAN